MEDKINDYPLTLACLAVAIMQNHPATLYHSDSPELEARSSREQPLGIQRGTRRDVRPSAHTSPGRPREEEETGGGEERAWELVTRYLLDFPSHFV